MSTSPEHAGTDPRDGSAGWSIAGAVVSLILVSIVVPAVVAFFGLVQSASFFGEGPSDAQRAQAASTMWVAFAISFVSLAIIIALAVSRRGRGGFVGLMVIVVLAAVLSLVWLAVAASAQTGADPATSPAQSRSATPSPTEADGRYLPDAQGMSDARAMITRLEAVSFPADADADQVRRLVSRAGAAHPETSGSAGDVAVGVVVGHRACVLGEVRAGAATWSVTGLSTDGGCLGARHA